MKNEYKELYLKIYDYKMSRAYRFLSFILSALIFCISTLAVLDVLYWRPEIYIHYEFENYIYISLFYLISVICSLCFLYLSYKGRYPESLIKWVKAKSDS